MVANRGNLKQCKLARLISLDVLVKVKMMEDKYQARSGFHEEECVCLRDAECVRDTSNTRIRTLKVDLQNLPLVVHDAVDTETRPWKGMAETSFKLWCTIYQATSRGT